MKTLKLFFFLCSLRYNGTSEQLQKYPGFQRIANQYTGSKQTKSPKSNRLGGSIGNGLICRSIGDPLSRKRRNNFEKECFSDRSARPYGKRN